MLINCLLPLYFAFAKTAVLKEHNRAVAELMVTLLHEMITISNICHHQMVYSFIQWIGWTGFREIGACRA